jgi:hypothetical protein
MVRQTGWENLRKLAIQEAIAETVEASSEPL